MYYLMYPKYSIHLNMAKKFRILSIDGGGLRGLIPVLVLRELERRSGKRVHEMFDLVAGTSTGGLIACAVAAGLNGKDPLLTLDQVYDVYLHRGQEIFPERSWAGNIISKFVSLKRPTYSTAGLSHVLKDLFHESKITDCLKPIFIPTYDLFNNEAVFFKGRHAAQDAASDALLYDVCRATSSAPTYFPPYDITYENKQRTFIDGGVFMNNPSVGAIIEISKYHADPIYNRPDLQFEDICVLSLGTGHYTAQIAQNKISNWGELDWAKPISDIMMQAVSQSIVYEAEELLADGQFLDLNMVISDPARAGMADASDDTRNYLIAETQKQITANKQQMDALDLFIQKAELA
jgi:patatin-like phospholipase/acyl hydrolase